MALFCDKDCEERGSICDFCKFYRFNGCVDGSYTGDGWCRKFNKQKEPEEGCGCSEFVCFRIGKEDLV